jgi:cell division transport system ATP-binding protein
MIRFDHVSKLYPGTKRPALDSIDLEILRGEFVFLVGPSGSGKSSCLRLILKEDKPSSGKIQVLGQDLGRISNRKVPYFRRNLGVVFQDFRLLNNKTVFDNVAFTLQVIGKSLGFIQEAVPDVLKMVGLDGKAQRMPHELSGGEQQRVAIARAVVNKPQILLADEPTGNLDPTTSAGIMALLERINAGGTTVLMATHEAGIVNQMQKRVVQLSDGIIVRDERQGGYGDTAQLSTQDAADQLAARTEEHPSGPPTVSSATVPASKEPVSKESAPTPIYESLPNPINEPAISTPPLREPLLSEEVETSTPEHAVSDEKPRTDGAAALPSASAHTTVPDIEQHPVDDGVPESLSLAEKLGLRARGEKHDPTSEQDVGPTK